MPWFDRRSMIATTVAFITLAMAPPSFAIQNIGFPDDSRALVMGASDHKEFQSAQKAMHDALSTLIVVGDIKGESKRYAKEFKSIGASAQVIEKIALRSGDKEVANFMSTIKSWSTSGDADDIAPELIRKIDDHIVNMKVSVK